MTRKKGSTSKGNPRANVKNPNNPSFKAARDNRSNQLNPNNPAHRSSRGQSQGKGRK